MTKLVFFDTEFTGLHKNTSLISIGCTTMDDRYFYFECTDYDKSQIDEWIQKNIIENLQFSEYDNNTIINAEMHYFQAKGDKQLLKKVLTSWLNNISLNGKHKIQLVSDVCHYDMVLFCDIYDGALNLPEFISPVCVDINDYIARFLKLTPQGAFNVDREEFTNIYDDTSLKKSSLSKHNSLWDAEIIKLCWYRCLGGI